MEIRMNEDVKKNEQAETAPGELVEIIGRGGLHWPL